MYYGMTNTHTYVCMYIERGVPERATESLAFKPLVAKVEISLSNPSVKLGRFSAKLLLAVVESLRPSLTVHDGPPTCH